MNKKGPIVIIEDDEDDRHILGMVFKELECENELNFFEDGQEAIEYLKREEVMPFLVISDINLPKLNGFQVRDIIFTNEALRKKSFPFIFFTTTSNRIMIREAFDRAVQGVFIKPDSIDSLRDNLRAILDYWSLGYAPNGF
jgi:CheY-like chemotaxis protein